MKVLALIEGPAEACYRYRIEAFAWALAERGLHLEAAVLRRDTPGRLAQLCAAGRADVVLLQRKLLPIWQLVLLRRAARRLIYDVDDAVFQRDSYSPKGPRSRVRLGRFWATVFAADAVIVGNHYLKRRTATYIGADRIRVIPTCVVPEWYRPAGHHRVGPRTRLVWIGQGSTLASLSRARAALTAAAERLPGLSLRLICDRTVDLSPLVVQPRQWSSATEAGELAAGDIGINWLPDDAWSRGKCGLKVLQYMAAGLPVVANPVGMNRRMVVSGETGLLASTPRQWAEAIARLAAVPRLRLAMGGAGRRLVQRRYSVARWGCRFAEVVESVARGGIGNALPPQHRRAAGPDPSPARPHNLSVAAAEETAEAQDTF
ncbi:MAG: glycosyltransferase family 4 protein [Pirellulales bacterium]|nr:glycosyltransferase family 4 protein [Pirellulales bacterium]